MSISRSADYTIQGFIYQFNKTLLEILNSRAEDTITVEGIIEDIDIVNEYGTTAIQCKYHESKEKFQLSTVYKPILQMMKHFHCTNANEKDLKISYRLFAFFPNETPEGFFKITQEHIKEIMASKNSGYQSMIEELEKKIKFEVEEEHEEKKPDNINRFLENFNFEFGYSLQDLTSNVLTALKENGFDEDDVEILHYPNAIQKISNLSMKHDKKEREINKRELIEHLSEIRKTAISRWTLSLKTLNKILLAKKKELKENLSKNSRLRYFVISESLITDFKDVVVNFISDYIAKYHFKAIHDKTPVFCFDCSPELFKDLIIRLHKKNIRVNRGLIVEGYFDDKEFLREPIRKNEKEYSREFDIRLTQLNSEIIEVFNQNKPDDYFLFTNEKLELDYQDTNLEHLAIENIKQIKFILGMSDIYE
ncbi:hypothetical protein [Kurthia gibsonii]|uniref:hypothetical protein n=1 Tax=Kurthia gibsonii TaxID=33946 RepID=UPI003019D43C